MPVRTAPLVLQDRQRASGHPDPVPRCDRVGQGTGERVGRRTRDAVDHAPVIQQAQPDQAGKGRIRCDHAQGLGRCSQGGAGHRNARDEQGRRGQLAGLVRRQCRPVGRKRQTREEGDQRVVRVLRHARIDQLLDFGRRHPGRQIGLNPFQRGGGRRPFPPQDRLGQHILQAGIATGGRQGPGQQGRRGILRIQGPRICLPRIRLPFRRPKLFDLIPNRHRPQRHAGKPRSAIPAPPIRQPEIIPAGEEKAGTAYRPAKRRQHRRQHGAVPGIHSRRVIPRGGGLQGPLQIVDHQQNRPVVQRAFQRMGQRLAQGGIILLDRPPPTIDERVLVVRCQGIRNRVEHGQRIVPFEDHNRC